MIPVLDPYHVELKQTALIEASAGTGKTYTITTLFTRLIAQGYHIDSILVVTFTEAAAAELKLRIRSRLADILDDLDRDINDSGDLLADFFRGAGKESIGLIRQRLRKAILCFDQASIMTIHSFCLQALKENAFESQAHFDVQLVPDSARFVRQVCRDYFGIHINHLDPMTLSFLKQKKFSPDYLGHHFKKILAKPGILMTPVTKGFEDVSGQYTEVCKQIKKMLNQNQGDIVSTISDHDGLNKKSYSNKNIKNWLEKARLKLCQSQMVPWIDMTEQGDSLYKFTHTRMEEKLKNASVLPVHPFFELCQELLGLSQIFENNLIYFKQQFLSFYDEALETQKKLQGVCFFDDLINDLAKAVEGPFASNLIASLRNRYRACMIDEFQDTDQRQYLIFSKTFQKTAMPFFMIGDPKQAIYAFRGGDIFSYLKASMESDHTYTLDINYRSAPLLVKGINQLFMLKETPFLFEQIYFQPVSTPPDAQDLFSNNGCQPTPPLQFLFIERDHGIQDKSGFIKKEAANRMIPQIVASDISGLLTSGARLLNNTGEGMPVSPADIAILVRKNSQAEEVKTALDHLGIPSYISKTGSVFETKQALDMIDILTAVRNPDNKGLILSALCTGLYGLTGDDLAGFISQESGLLEWQDRFRAFNRLWEKTGFMSMCHEIFHSEQAFLDSARDLSERAVTNYYHMAELLHRQVLENHLKPDALLKWFKEQQIEDMREETEDELRLDSDKEAVAIVTIHKSKGLEYPVVYLPYLWEGPKDLSGDQPILFHDPQKDNAMVVDFGSQNKEQSKQMAIQEDASEQARLLYVALTRSAAMCRVIWAGIKGVEASSLGKILHDPGNVSDAQMIDDLYHLKAKNEECIDVQLYRPQGVVPDEKNKILKPRKYICKNFKKEILPAWGVTSFSSITSETQVTETSEETQEQELTEEDEIILSEFPKGAGTGELFHKIFEDLDFSTTHKKIKSQVDEKLNQFGFQKGPWSESVCQSVNHVLSTPLTLDHRVLCLKDIPNSSRLNEMEFLFTAEPFSISNLVSMFGKYLPDDYKTVYLDKLSSLSQNAIKGFIKGFIDLVFLHDGQWYIIDYKSNFLGRSYKDYANDHLNHAMADHHYFLQYHLYVIALHRYLQNRVPGYEYESHFGGVFYLFIRGMHPENLSSFGVFSDRPSKALIESLSGGLQHHRAG